MPNKTKELTYWDYLNLDTLLNCQKNRQSKFNDETIFLIYHQICELYFKLIIQEITLIQKNQAFEYLDKNKPPNLLMNWMNRLDRIDNYFCLLINSFSVLSIKGLSTDEFYKFRDNLKHVSGFQTAQFRTIEIMLTSLKNLIVPTSDIDQLKIEESNNEEKYELIYWKKGAIEMGSNKKSQMLINFEKKYDEEFKELIIQQKNLNLFTLFQNLTYPFIKKDNEKDYIQWEKFKDFVNLKLVRIDNLIYDWKFKHFETVGEHMNQFKKFDESTNGNSVSPNEQIQGTGGTNAHEFLTQSLKTIRYFPLR